MYLFEYLYVISYFTPLGFGDMVALQKDNALNNKPQYVMFALIFILFGLAIVAASLNLLVLRFVTMNTEDERRDEAQAMQVGNNLSILFLFRYLLFKNNNYSLNMNADIFLIIFRQIFRFFINFKLYVLVYVVIVKRSSLF